MGQNQKEKKKVILLFSVQYLPKRDLDTKRHYKVE